MTQLLHSLFGAQTVLTYNHLALIGLPALCLIVLILTVLAIHLPLVRKQKLREHGTKTSGVVLEKKTKITQKNQQPTEQQNSLYGNQAPVVNISYSITYSFNDANGKAHKKRMQCPAWLAARVAEGAPLEIYYETNRPRFNFPVDFLDQDIEMQKKARILAYLALITLAALYLVTLTTDLLKPWLNHPAPIAELEQRLK